MTAPLTICLATQNQHKVGELRELLALHAPELLPRLRVVSLAELGISDEPIEDGADFDANARIKSQAAFAASGFLSLADDSGLEVTALDGAPGLYSARYGGPPRPGQSRDARNREVLLEALRDVPEAARQARFVCVLSLLGKAQDGSPIDIIRRGACSGHMLFAEHGENGFGYDPLFVPEAHELAAAGLAQTRIGLTYAELSPDEKSRLSHRARALCNLIADLTALSNPR